MSILARSEILEEIQNGNIRITPFDETMVGPASIDLRLSNAFRIFVDLPCELEVTEKTDFREATKGYRVPAGGYLTLQPGQTVLGITTEKVETAANICGWLEGRSRFARVGLLVHVSSSFMQPGLANHQVLEMSNFGPIPLRVYPGTPVCQFIFQRIAGSARYSGSFQGQTPEDFVRG
ncbi:MAG: dCTP deaminase [Myxococcota bacterium]|jgi:dCTP deaminase|nr:dCTP deaminase [Myxococcota bacterium]